MLVDKHQVRFFLEEEREVLKLDKEKKVLAMTQLFLTLELSLISMTTIE